MPGQRTNLLIRSFFYGNYFYGICAVALSMEASLQQSLPLNHPLYFLVIFCLTVVFYTRAYITDSSGYPSDERNAWYMNNKTEVGWSQVILGTMTLVLMAAFAFQYFDAIRAISSLHLSLFILFPLVAALYYGAGPKLNIRRIGRLKPFIIGFAWAGIVTVYPILFYCLKNQIPFQLTVIGCVLFLKNFMFISILCIMFDIKDYSYDASTNVNTFIVRRGLRKTIFFIIIPLCVLGLGTFIAYGIYRHFHPMKIFLNVIPFAFLIWVAYSLHTRRNLLYYLVWVDGLMLLKAVCGTVAMLFYFP